MIVLAAPLRERLLRELRYCLWAGGAMGRDRGEGAEAQQVALQQGWLQPDPQRPGFLRLTHAGRSLLPLALWALTLPLWR